MLRRSLHRLPPPAAALLALAFCTGQAAATGDVAPAPADSAKSEKPWKVTDEHGPSRTLAFDTDEGTWLALDVHPDGRQIVFSLLGDLYLLPIAGGEARRITSGPAYDVQPRFSPDGRWIAFASDRGGLENLWVCDREGKNARQVSSEKERTVNSPAWSPDGDYLVGRKRVTDTSSLATVELWMWHLKGGEGIALTKKDEQPDAADPEFSPDGRFLYLSARDSRYRYDRNVYEGIWQIKRMDRKTGQTVPLTGEFGGAATPAVSPDGKTLAFVRRVSARTRLELMDLQTGRTRVLVASVERDNQEGFCFHGVFPGYAWTPDGRALVATAEGKLWRFDAATGARTPIPFTAHVEQRVTDALRFHPDPAPDRVRARVIRWPVESPDGRQLVFSALGHLYVMALPQGTPRRLTRLEDFEYAPAFSPDGRELAFVTWNDREGGHVWKMPIGPKGGGAPKRLTELPGQYVNPSFSPDGSKLVFVRGSGAAFRDNDLSDELWLELHWMSASGGPTHYVIGTKNRGASRRVTRPTFSPDGERVLYVEDDPAEKPFTPPRTALVSVKLDGTDKRTAMRWQKAGEATPSPDGRWVAFNELHNAYVTALPRPGTQTVELSLEGSPLPLAQLTDDVGEWVSWADRGRVVTWISGPTYHRIPLDRAVPTPKAEDEEKAAEGNQEKKAERPKLPPSDSLEIVLEVPRARPGTSVAYTGARIITLKGDQVIERGTVWVEGDRIKAVGDAREVTVPRGVKVVYLNGRTLMPGLFDEHAHLHYSALDVFPQRPWKYLANLAYGVTSTHDPSATTHEVFGQSEMVQAGLVVGPRIFSTGSVLYGADAPDRALTKSLDDARRHLRRMKRFGAFSVKSYMQPARNQRQWLLQAAREESLMVVPEGGGDLEMDMTMVLDGHTTVEHALPVTPLRKDVVTLLGRSQTAYTPTLLVAYGGISGDRWFYQHYDVWKDERLLRVVPQGVVDPPSRIRSIMAGDEDWHHIDVAASAKRVMEAGGRVCLGGHGQMQGLGPHWELWAFVQGGMTPLEALRVGALYPAQALGMDRDLGSLEAGKLADFVVLERNPLEDIHHTTSIERVVKNGVEYGMEELKRVR